MSLAAFQKAWVQQMLNYPVDRTGLNAKEQSALNALSPAKLRSLQSATRYGRESVFVAATPRSLHTLLGKALISELARDFAHDYPEAGLYPLAENLPTWLAYIAYRKGDSTPHLNDLAYYESAKMLAVFFGLPQPASALPRRAPAAQCFLAGPDFLTVYRDLEQCAQFRDSPKQAYLYLAHPLQPQIYTLHWTIYSVFILIDGNLSWEQAVDHFLTVEPELADQKRELLAWENTLRSYKALI